MTEAIAADSPQTILVVDDDAILLDVVQMMLVSHGIRDVVTLNTSGDLLKQLDRGGIGVLLMDWIMPGMTGAELLPIIVQRYPHIPVIIMTGVNDLQTVVGCIKQGAFDYVTKPIDVNRLLSSIHKAFQISELANQNRRLKSYLMGDSLTRPEIFDAILTINPRMQAIFKIVETMRGSYNPVLITGETGVGKELIARAVHRASGLKGPFVALNVAGLDELMFDDTLFGHKKGAFTGANESREGLIAKAQGGTLFLDEVGDMGQESQVKLLRLLQEHEYYRLGSDALIKSDARIIAASNHDFETLLEQGRFRRDLYHRLRGHHIHVLPLRERREDIPLLLDHFLQTSAKDAGRPVPVVSAEVRRALEEYEFPGNVRELMNMVHHAVTSHDGAPLTVGDFLGDGSAVGRGQRQLRVFRDRDFRMQVNCREFPSLDVIEQMLIDEALRITGGSKSQAAELLGISRPTLNKKLASKEE
ncbi:MAG TPA: sigma-54 dependent transcriptional regulator [Desulfuromonadaceae bacterium]